MNFQTVKARAKAINGGAWLVTHPGTLHGVITSTPHDTAAYLLKEFVLRNQIMPRVK